ncbi:single-stranded DNA-binding protein [Candidatus Fermentibacterales bacterium]|nr:single-stranded DNA-binding protein [Candidatus Fermentibacterales bacterium]
MTDTGSLDRPEVNYCVFTGRVIRREGLRMTSGGYFTLVFFVENTMDRGREADDRETRVASNTLRVISWGRSAQALDDKVRVGSEVLVEGYLSSLDYEDRSKATHHRMEVTARSVQVLQDPDTSRP